MVKYPAYNHRSPFCRMQDKNFRRYYIDHIPNDANLAYPMRKLPRIDEQK